MARIEAGQNRDAGRAREWLAKAARGAPDPAWVAPDGTVSSEWQAVAPKSGALGVFEWKTPPVPAAASIEAGLPELECVDIQAEEPAPAAPSRPAGELEIIAPAQAGGQFPVPEAPAQQQGGAPETPAKADEGPGEPAANATEAESKVPSAADSGDGSPGKAKPEIREAKIFVSGPAPDDPGPQAPESDEVSTPLSRFRNPS
jgi:HemY protein